jgi:hypothetical protein
MKGSVLISKLLQAETRGAAPQLEDTPVSATAVGMSQRRTMSLRSASSFQDLVIGNLGTNW